MTVCAAFSGDEHSVCLEVCYCAQGSLQGLHYSVIVVPQDKTSAFSALLLFCFDMHHPAVRFNKEKQLFVCCSCSAEVCC